MVERSLSMWEVPGSMPGFSNFFLSLYNQIFSFYINGGLALMVERSLSMWEYRHQFFLWQKFLFFNKIFCLYKNLLFIPKSYQRIIQFFKILISLYKNVMPILMLWYISISIMMNCKKSILKICSLKWSADIMCRIQEFNDIVKEYF